MTCPNIKNSMLCKRSLTKSLRKIVCSIPFEIHEILEQAKPISSEKKTKQWLPLGEGVGMMIDRKVA